jgi:hypothetical protein
LKSRERRQSFAAQRWDYPADPREQGKPNSLLLKIYQNWTNPGAHFIGIRETAPSSSLHSFASVRRVCASIAIHAAIIIIQRGSTQASGTLLFVPVSNRTEQRVLDLPFAPDS